MTLVEVTFRWDDRLGACAECGNPAAYAVPDAYGMDEPLTSENLRCCLCAALAASDGERIVHLSPDDHEYDGGSPAYKAIIDHYDPRSAT